MLTQTEALTLFRYDRRTGKVFRRSNGKELTALWTTKPEAPYLRTFIKGKSILLHRLIWLMETGDWPEADVDHRDGDTLNNRWENLRDVTRQVNLQNVRKPRKSNRSTGVLGVSLVRGRFRVQIRAGSMRKHIGYYADLEEAQATYIRAKREYHAGCTI